MKHVSDNPILKLLGHSLVVAMLSTYTIPSLAGNGALQLEPGMWKIISTPNFPRVPIPATPKTDTICLTAKDIEAGNIPVRLAPHCSILGGVHKDAVISLKVDCGEIRDASARIYKQGKSFSGDGEMLVIPGEDGQGRVEFFFKYTGQWLSECPQPSPESKPAEQAAN